MKLLYWNVYVGHHVDDVLRELRGMIKDYKPEVIGLGECMHVAPHLDQIKGYRAFTLKETTPGSSDTAVLVRDDVALKRWYWMILHKWWRGPKHGKAQGPKRYWSGRIRHNKKTYRISIGHWPFNWAVDETEDRIVKWFKHSIPLRKSGHFGDLNMGADESDRYVRRFNGKHTGHGVDRALYKNMKVTYRALGKHGSDHEAVLFTLN